MHIEEDGTKTFSHTSIALWNLCQRRWFWRYVQHQREPVGLQAAWSVAMVHQPIELGALQAELSQEQWTACFKTFLEMINEKDAPDDLHTIDHAQRCIKALAGVTASYDIRGREITYVQPFALSRYSTRPDLIIESGQGWRTTVDFKYTEAKWQSPKRPWPVKELLPYDDQLLGQGVVSKADSFTRITLRVNPQTGEYADPIIQEHPVDGFLRQEWLRETASTIMDIERSLEGKAPFAKNTNSCYAYGRACPFINQCKNGGTQIAKCSPTE